MTSLLQQIRENLASQLNGAIRLDMGENNDHYPAWTFCNGAEFGVMVPFDSQQPVAESFSNCSIHTRNLHIEDSDYSRYLVLSSTDRSLRNEFALICDDFVNPGKNGIRRTLLLYDPFAWWEKWKELLGNAISENKTYSVLGEMLVLENLIRNNKKIIWSAAAQGSHDIESPEASYEVKSTLQKYKSQITISSQTQMEDDHKELFIYFIRFESSEHGICINDLVRQLIYDGYNASELEKQLSHMGYESGCMARNQKYRILEKRKYNVDEHFPKITKNSFKDNKLPNSIVKVEYTIDLDGLDYEKW